VYGDHM
jgi:hypothetical protein